MDLPDAAELTREQIIEVMRACDITDFSEEAIQQCVADALAIREQSAATTMAFAPASVTRWAHPEAHVIPVTLS